MRKQSKDLLSMFRIRIISIRVWNVLLKRIWMAFVSDMESAEGMLAVMRQAGLEPNDDTYTTLMSGYAQKGDVENVHRIAKVLFRQSWESQGEINFVIVIVYGFHFSVGVRIKGDISDRPGFLKRRLHSRC